MPTPAQQARNRLAAAARRKDPPEKIAEARRALTKTTLAERIREARTPREAVATWAPLTPEDRAELAVLLLTDGRDA